MRLFPRAPPQDQPAIAGRLHFIADQVMSRTLAALILLTASFHAPDRSGHKVTVDAAFVETNLGALARSADISRYVL